MIFTKREFKKVTLSASLPAILTCLLTLSSQQTSFAQDAETPAAESIGLKFIDTSFENASPLHYEVDDKGQVNVFLLYDHERSSPNRAAGHWHFRVQARKGSQQTIVFNKPFDQPLNNPVSSRLESVCASTQKQAVRRVVAANANDFQRSSFNRLSDRRDVNEWVVLDRRQQSVKIR
jgi:hypothetical protein